MRPTRRAGMPRKASHFALRLRHPTGLLEGLRQRRPVLASLSGAEVRHEIPNPGGVGPATREERGAGRGADTLLDVRAREDHTLSREGVQVWRDRLRLA